MSVPNSVEELIQLIRKSGMIEESKLSGYMQRRQFAQGLPPDLREIVDEMVRDGVMTYFQSEQFLLGKSRGFTIGKYKLLERIGVGGMGQVFLCEHMFMKKRLAIKVLPPQKAEQPAALGRFYREARAAGSLEHPNIVRTHDIDQDGNLHFIVMDYVDGPNLLNVVKKHGPMEIGRAVSYMSQVAIALDYAFRSKIIHRDVKPGNILIDRKGVARILDLGLARFINDHSDQLTLKYDDKIVLGTADYVAPEQVANSHAVDIRADIYAMGATFYCLLAGHPPFPSGTVSQKLLWHRTKEPTAIRTIRPEIPDALAAVIAKMMAKDPKARYQTPAQVAVELEAWMPAVVTLPSPEEMPQLSPAASEGMPGAAVDFEERPGLAAAADIARTAHASATAVLTESKPVIASPAPFGPSNGSPWGHSEGDKPISGARRSALPSSPQAVVDTALPASEPTPAVPRRNPFITTNPFPGGDDSEVSGKQMPWAVILAVGAAVLVTLALVITKL